MECAGKGRGVRCVGPPVRRCARCEAVAYCSVSHQISHWSFHKEECERLEQQMKRADVLNEFPFTFAHQATVQVCEGRETRCSFLTKRGIHQQGMWKHECCCAGSVASSNCSRLIKGWNLPSTLCPCTGPSSPIPEQLSGWEHYYEWRSIPLDSPVALLLHWPLTLYQAIQLAAAGKLIHEIRNELRIHYLGPDKELHQLAAFGELRALFPGVEVHIELVGPAIPQFRNGERICIDSYANCADKQCSCNYSRENLSSLRVDRTSAVTIRLHKGHYHDLYGDILKDSLPHLIFAANAGIAVYKSWLPTIELIKELNVPAVFSDYCEEASYLAASCLSTISGHPPSIPIQLNPFRQPMVVEDSVLHLPCYSNCFLFGM
ncbi:hypothetical protein NMG60_11008939 [Bertholletia excelsa]